jgi:Ca2+-binding EF-hand superfamily protein
MNKFNEYLFKSFNYKNNGVLSLEEYKVNFIYLIIKKEKNRKYKKKIFKKKVQIKGTKKEQIKMAYEIFDQESKGYIKKDEFIKIFKIIYKIIEMISIEIPEGIDEYINKIFHFFDKNNDEKINKNEFIQILENNPEYFEGFFFHFIYYFIYIKRFFF